MKTIKLSCLFVFLLAQAQVLHSQGEIIIRGKNAYAAEFAYASSKIITVAAPGLAISFGGVVDFSAAYSIIQAKQTTPDIGNASSAISLGLAVHALKASESNPLTVSGILGYQIQSFHIEHLNDSRSFASWVYGPAVHFAIRQSESNYAQPSLAILFVSKADQDPDITVTTISRITTFSVPIIFERERSIFVIGPSLGFSSGNTTYGISIAFVGFLAK